MKKCSSCGRIYAEQRDFLKNTSRWRICSSGNLYFNCSCESTLLIPKGKYEWYSPSLFMGEKAKSVFNSLAAPESLPYLPAVAIQLQDALNNPDTPASLLAGLCKQDPALAVNIIGAANAMRHVHTKLVTSIEQAIGLLGRKRVATLALTAALSSFSFNCVSYPKRVYFEESLLGGVTAEYLAGSFVEQVQGDLAYVAGCFCNVGKILSAAIYPEETDRIYRLTEDLSTACDWSTAEKRLGATDHTILGEIACALWGLEPAVLQCVQYHHACATDEVASVHPLLPCVIFANQIIHLVNLSSHRVQPVVLDSCLRYFSLDRNDLEKMVNDITPLRMQIREQVARMWP
jgi:HD-like signal output (HDOD) protein